MSLFKHFFAAEKNGTAFYSGRGISIAFLDTGISPAADFILPKNRIVAFRDLVSGKTTPYDDNGHGTHVTETKKTSQAETIIRRASPYEWTCSASLRKHKKPIKSINGLIGFLLISMVFYALYQIT